MLSGILNIISALSFFGFLFAPPEYTLRFLGIAVIMALWAISIARYEDSEGHR